jgi:hypothetical protein
MEVNAKPAFKRREREREREILQPKKKECKDSFVGSSSLVESFLELHLILLEVQETTSMLIRCRIRKLMTNPDSITLTLSK